jgi:predicted site-specific integrase-resolvase
VLFEKPVRVLEGVGSETGGFSNGSLGRAPRKVGYARVSTQGQSLDQQLAVLKEAGCTKTYSEKVSSTGPA